MCPLLKMGSRLALLFTLGALGACAGTPPPDKVLPRERCYSHGEIRTCSDYPAPSRQQVADVAKLRPPPVGVSRLILVRNDWRDAHGQTVLKLDGVVLPAMIPCSVVGVDTRPGEHVLRVAHGGAVETSLALTLRPQAVQVVKVTNLRRGEGQRGASLQRMAHADALSPIQECTVVALIDRTSLSTEVR